MEAVNSLSAALTSLDVSRKAEIRAGQPRLPITEETLAELEREFGYPLPTDYRAYLIEFGGLTIYNVPLPASRKDRRALGRCADSFPHCYSNVSVYGLYAADAEGLHSQDLRWRIPATAKMLPEGFFPFGEHLQYRTLCLSCRSEDFGAVYLHFAGDAEIALKAARKRGERRTTPAPLDLCVRIAPDFTAFILSVRCAPEEESDDYNDRRRASIAT